MKRLKILDIWVDPVTREEAVQIVEGFLSQKRPHSIFSVNPEKTFSIPKDAVLYETFKNADLLLPDGIGIVLAARILYRAQLERLPGSEFIFDICSIAELGNYRVFIYGAKESVNRKAVDELKNLYPNLKIVGRENGFIKNAKMQELIYRINESKADILFIALGSPKQEEWYSTYKKQLINVRVVQGIGGTLDTIAGNVKRAPRAWCELQLEWLYRLIMEPKRIKRQKVLPVFALQVIMNKIRNIVGSSK